MPRPDEKFLTTPAQIHERRMACLRATSIGAAVLAACVTVNESGNHLWSRSATAVGEHTVAPVIAWMRGTDAGASAETPFAAPPGDRSPALPDRIMLAGIEPEESEQRARPPEKLTRFASRSAGKSDADAPDGEPRPGAELQSR